MRVTARPPFGVRALALAVAFGLAATASAQEPRAWRHGVIEPKGDGGFLMMVGRRDFAQKHGLKIEIAEFKNGAIAHRALLAGEVESIESSPGAAILAGARGADLKIVGCDWPGDPHGLMVRSGIAKVEDLKGKTIAVAAPGSLPNLVIGALLEKYNIAPSEIRLANLGGDPERYKALVAGVADAGIIAAEFMAVAPPGVKMLVDGRDVIPNYVRLCLTMTGKTLSGRRADAARFVAAEIEALRYAVSHRAETIALTHEVAQIKPDDPRPAFAFDDTIKFGRIDPEVALPLDKLAWMQSELVKSGNLAKPVELSTLIDAGVRAQALQLIGK